MVFLVESISEVVPCPLTPSQVIFPAGAFSFSHSVYLLLRRRMRKLRFHISNFILNENQNQTIFNGRRIISKLELKRTVRFDICE